MLTHKTNAIKRALAAMIAAMMLVMLFACNGNGNGDGSDGSSSADDAPELVTLCADGASEYKIVRPDSDYGKVLKEAVGALRTAVKKAAGVELDVAEDWVKDTADIPGAAKEILVGATNRPESISALKELKTDDFCVRFFAESGRVVIVGGSDEATSEAVDYFIKNFAGTDGGGVAMKSDFCYFGRGSYEVEKLTVDGSDISGFEIVIPDNANRDEKFAASVIAQAVSAKTGVALTTVTVKKTSGGPSFRIGGAVTSVTCGADEFCVGKDPADATALLIGGKNGMAVAAARAFVRHYIDGLSGSADLEVPAAAAVKFASAVYPEDAAGIVGGTRIALADQKNSGCYVVDIDGGSNNTAALWSFRPEAKNGFNVSKFGDRIDECRLRYSTVLGTYVICVTSSSGYVAVGEYPSGKCVFDTSLPGYGPHSIEYLPSGAVALACSGNGDETKASIKFYAADEKGKVKLRAQTVSLVGAHGVIWDDVREVLWTVGTNNVVAFEVTGSGTDAQIAEIPVYGATLPKKGGHDIAAFYGDRDKLWVGGGNIVVFDKSTGSFTAAPGSVSKSGTKCIGSLDDGRIIRTAATGVYAEHDTDRFSVFDADGKLISEVVFGSRAFYKARLFNPLYS